MVGARVARFELPGKRWYIAACLDCRWVSLDWREKGWAKSEAKDHNKVCPTVLAVEANGGSPLAHSECSSDG